MTVDVTLTGTTLTVDGERVAKDWGFTRKGNTVRLNFYTVARWGRRDMTMRWSSQSASANVFRRDVEGFEGEFGSGYSAARTFTMSHAEFARFVEKFYGRTLAEGQEVVREIAARERVARDQERLRDVRNEAHSVALALVATATAAMHSESAVIALILDSHKSGFTAGREEGYDDGYEAGRSSGYSDAYLDYDENA